MGGSLRELTIACPRLFVVVALRLRRSFTGDRFFLFQKSGHAVGVPFVGVVAECMTQFMADREVKKVPPCSCSASIVIRGPAQVFAGNMSTCVRAGMGQGN